MSISTGIAFAFVAMFAWGFGDFLIQKNVRRIGNLSTLFFITLFGALVLLPFTYNKIYSTINNGHSLIILLVTSAVLFIAAVLDFQGLKIGNLSIVEPIWSLEIPAASFLAFFVLGETISLSQIIIIILLLISLILLAIKKANINKSIKFERGVIVAIAGALAMGFANFMMGWGGRETDFVMVNFFTDSFIAIVTLVLIIIRGNFYVMCQDIKREWRSLVQMSIADKIAWLAFVLSMSLVPIAIATALSESYIIIAVLLGIFISKERLAKHQKVALICAIILAIVLAGSAGN